MNLLALKTPGNDGNPGQDLTPPSGIPEPLRGGLNSTQNLIQLGIELLVLGGVVAAVIVFMVSGIQWMTSGGDSSKIAAAKKRLFFAILGIIVMSASFFIVRLVFTTLGGEPAKFLTPGAFLK